MLSLAMYGWVFNLGLMMFLIVCFLLILMVMIQKPQGGGLSAAFGASSGSGQTAFGTKTGDALTVATILLFVVWLVVAMALNVMTKPDRSGPSAPQAPAQAPAQPPANTPAPANGANPATPPTTPPGNTPAPGPEGTPAANPSNPAPAPAPANPTPATPEKPADPANPK